jgi:predicted DNA binding CopG/RHH family protein
MKKVNIDDINNYIAETIEMLKNNSDENASPNEKIDVETAKTIAELSKVAIDGYKVKAQVLGIVSKTENLTAIKELAEASGFANNGKLLGQ